MGPGAGAARCAARHRARSQHAAAGPPAGALARFGARVPEVPAYAEAFQAIGPAAIKLGQALAPGPTWSARRRRTNLPLLQDSLPPAPFAADQERRSSAALGAPLEQLFADDRSRAGRRRVDRAGPSRRHHRRPRKSR